MVRRMLRGGGVCEVVLEGSERRREGNRSHQENKQTNKEIQNRHTHNTSSTNKKSNLANRQQQADTFRTKLPNEDLLL